MNTTRDLRIDGKKVTIVVWHDGSEKPSHEGKFLVETSAWPETVDVARFEGGYWQHRLGPAIYQWAEWPAFPGQIEK